MRISYQWLAEYVDLPPVDDLRRRLTAVGFEVEAVERTGGGLSGVVAARIVASEKHPDAERLSVTRVDPGGGELLQIVCGARNYRVGDLVPLARVGTELPGGIRIEKARLRGVESFGMLCSSKELGLDADAAGLLILPPDVVPGTPLVDALRLEDVLLEVNVTPNRPDALSHLGLSREVAAATGAPVRAPEVRLVEGGGPAEDAVRIRIEAPARCPRYAARVIEGVKIGPSPAWLARRLERCGVRSISNVVDATNFVLLELGHPLHAFDLERVAGREIVVRAARPDEKLTTLDGKVRSLDPDDLVIADRDRASALAGVMGGGDSEISAGTKRVLLESAWFEPSGIRRSSRRHALKTEASYRFERGADPGMVTAALDRCAALIAALASGTVRGGVVDAYPRPFQPRRVRLRHARPREMLGLEVGAEETRRILAALGFVEEGHDAEGTTWRVPSWRQDVSIEEDLVEEVVRERGYDAIPETLPPLALKTPGWPAEAQALSCVRAALEAEGYSDAVNFSFVAASELAAFDPQARPIELKNPISADLSAMRTSLLPSLLKNVAYNLRQRVEDVRVYEIARCYGRGEGEGGAPAKEWLEVAGVLFGRRSPVGWATPSDRADLYDAKAAVEGVLAALGVSGLRFQVGELPWGHPRFSAALVGEGDPTFGHLAEVHPRVAAAFGLPRGVFAFRLDLEKLLGLARLRPVFKGVPRFPAVLRDLAVVVDDAVEADQVLTKVREEPLVEKATLFDVYIGAPLPPGRKNLALALSYRDPTRTLTDAEVDAAHARIVAKLAGDPTVRAELRA
ncbi:MAG TPA: phenylalanine--tRNA ligase subunit beta [Anaeromyxobacteraceae bacterium]|nr:phenylalanine--tRNA ligase subunit beta [Anaeromyxobacteraceae bacterium]